MAGILALAKYGVLLGALSIAAVVPSAQIQPTARVKIGTQSGLVLSAAGSIWTTDFALGRVVRVDPAKNSVTKRIALPGRPFGMAYGAGSLWVADRSANVLARINPRTNRVVKRISIGFSTYGVGFGAGSVYPESAVEGGLVDDRCSVFGN